MILYSIKEVKNYQLSHTTEVRHGLPFQQLSTWEGHQQENMLQQADIHQSTVNSLHQQAFLFLLLKNHQHNYQIDG